MEHDRQSETRGDWLKSRSNWVLLAFLAIAGFYLITEHRAHLWGFLPFLILLACPFMHMFMHHGHGHGGHGHPHGQRRSTDDERPGQ